MPRRLMSRARRARVTVCAALFLYCLSMIFLVWPPNTAADAADRWGYIVVTVLAGVAAIGLVAFAVPAIHLPGEEYAYLVTGWAGFTALAMYLITTDDPHPRRIAITLVVATGVVGSYGAYLDQDDELV